MSYIDINGIQHKAQAEVRYYGMEHDPMWTVALPDVVEGKNECVGVNRFYEVQNGKSIIDTK